MFWAIPLGIFLVFLVPEIIFLACLCIAAVYNDVLTKFKTRGNILGKVRNTQSPETAHEAAALAGYRLEVYMYHFVKRGKNGMLGLCRDY